MDIITSIVEKIEHIPNLYYRDLMGYSYSGSGKLHSNILKLIATENNMDVEDIIKNLDYDLDKAQKMLWRTMDDNLHNIPRAFATARERGWDKIYLFADIHDTILCPDYASVAKIYEPMAKEVLKKISDRKDICLCLYTCSYPLEIRDYTDHFEKDGIVFEHINENSEAKNTKHGYFREKPYMNILLEDKAGFDAKTDWYIIDQLLDNEEILVGRG